MAVELTDRVEPDMDLEITPQPGRLAPEAHRHGRVRLWPWVVTAAVAVAGLVGVGVANQRAERDETQVAVAIGATHDSVVYEQERMRGTVEYVSGALFSWDTSREVREDISAMLGGEASASAERLQGARVPVAALDPVAWRSDLEQARDDYLVFLDARIAILEKAGTDPRVLFATDASSPREQRRAVESLGRALDDDDVGPLPFSLRVPADRAE